MINKYNESKFDFDSLIILICIILIWICVAVLVNENYPSYMPLYEIIRALFNSIKIETIYIPFIPEAVTLTIYAGGKIVPRLKSK